MKHLKVKASHVIKLTLFISCLVLVSGVGAFRGTFTQSGKERRLNVREFNKTPIKIKGVKNLQKEEDWFRDLEIEVQNVSDKPIYFMEVSIDFPNVPAPTPTPHPETGYIPKAVTGFGIMYGAERLIDVRELAGPDDVPLKPGETYVFKVPDYWVIGFEYMKKEKKNLSPKIWNKVVIGFGNVSFGNGTGFVGGRRVSYPKSGTKSARRKTASPFVGKVNWVRPSRASPLPVFASVAVIPQTSSCPSGCDRYYIESDANTASCIDSSTPPLVCP